MTFEQMHFPNGFWKIKPYVTLLWTGLKTRRENIFTNSGSVSFLLIWSISQESEQGISMVPHCGIDLSIEPVLLTKSLVQCFICKGI